MRRVAFVFTFLLVAGCGLSSTADDHYRDRLEAWREKAPPRYRWTLVVSEPIFGPRRITVLVDGGEVVEAHSGKERLEIDNDEADGLPATVDALIEHLIEAAPDAKSLHVDWAAAGYPSKVRLDASDASDDEISYTVESFHPVGTP
jgi:hypothetical protein